MNDSKHVASIFETKRKEFRCKLFRFKKKKTRTKIKRSKENDSKKNKSISSLKNIPQKTRGELLVLAVPVYHFYIVLVDFLPRGVKARRKRRREKRKKGCKSLETPRYNQFASNSRLASGGPRRRAGRSRSTRRERGVESGERKERG